MSLQALIIAQEALLFLLRFVLRSRHNPTMREYAKGAVTGIIAAIRETREAILTEEEHAQANTP